MEAISGNEVIVGQTVVLELSIIVPSGMKSTISLEVYAPFTEGAAQMGIVGMGVVSQGINLPCLKDEVCFHLVNSIKL